MEVVADAADAVGAVVGVEEGEEPWSGWKQNHDSDERISGGVDLGPLGLILRLINAIL